MLLTNRQTTFNVPHTSQCYIVSRGQYNDGDMIQAVSSIFSSINLITGSKLLDLSFDVKLRIMNGAKSIEFEGDDAIVGTLVCDDNDIFNMYVRV